jgi:DNA polymerase
MSDEAASQLRDIARQLEAHLRFYRDLGIADIGGGAPPASAPDKELSHSRQRKDRQVEAPPADERDPAVPERRRESAERSAAEVATEKKPGVQSGLFGETEAPVPARQPIPSSTTLVSIVPVDESLEAIRDDIGDCTRCRLHERRKTIVFGEGDPRARLMFIGEGPGAEEDLTGRPFVGRAGQLLDKIIEAIGLRREEVYIANIVKCRPPDNRTPERDEVATCEPFLFRQIALIKPEVIVALGSPAFQCLLRTRDPITRSRGQWREWNGIRVMPTFHPAYLLRSPDKKRETWEDMKKVRDYLAGRSA